MSPLRPIAPFTRYLSDIAKFLNLEPPKKDVPVSGLCLESSKIQDGDLFVAIRGEKKHGASFWDSSKSPAVITDKEGSTLLPDGSPILIAGNLRENIGELADRKSTRLNSSH